ncbi:hypothetical protein C8R44DRAFT_729291 [Mycena epipterygia]|nr:hypothetical protein C8R44DRAFT_729291 [Mycena epipterygia]
MCQWRNGHGTLHHGITAPTLSGKLDRDSCRIGQPVNAGFRSGFPPRQNIIDHSEPLHTYISQNFRTAYDSWRVVRGNEERRKGGSRDRDVKETWKRRGRDVESGEGDTVRHEAATRSRRVRHASWRRGKDATPRDVELRGRDVEEVGRSERDGTTREGRGRWDGGGALADYGKRNDVKHVNEEGRAIRRRREGGMMGMGWMR